MESYHYAWLSVHPERSAAWLEDRLKDGFDVHHLDGNHNNDAPENLVLIDCGDHLMLHGTKRRISRIINFNRPKAARDEDLLARGKRAYEAYDPAKGWRDAASKVGLDHLDGAKARFEAGKYALEYGLPWPLGRTDRKHGPKLTAAQRLAQFAELRARA
ncbi:MAG: hypothetical protein JST16_11620 [Bdellovibrionales bacterium]|nr:hypothetical protein [Bdellovibrionales bacterium]